MRRDQIVVGVEKLEARSGFPLLHAAGLELTRACLKASPGEAKLFPDESFRIGKIDRINPALIRYLIEKSNTRSRNPSRSSRFAVTRFVSWSS